MAQVTPAQDNPAEEMNWLAFQLLECHLLRSDI
jgi:hypothetical protein